MRGCSTPLGGCNTQSSSWWPHAHLACGCSTIPPPLRAGPLSCLFASPAGLVLIMLVVLLVLLSRRNAPVAPMSGGPPPPPSRGPGSPPAPGAYGSNFAGGWVTGWNTVFHLGGDLGKFNLGAKKKSQKIQGCQRNNTNNRPLTPKSMPPAGDEHTKPSDVSVRPEEFWYFLGASN